MNMYRTIKGKKIHVNQLAAMSRKFTVRNNTIHKLGLNSKNIVIKFKEIPTARFDTPIFGKMFEIDKDGHYHLIERGFDPTPLMLNHKQPKSYWYEIIDGKPTKVKSTSLHKDPVKMNRVQYMEKLVEHKLAKWDKKNPKPQQDLFDKVEDWEQRRFIAEQRFRDFVVSVYDPLTLTGRFVVGKGNSATYQEKKVAEIKDINGEGHVVNNLSNNSKLMKKVQKVTNHMRNKYPNLVSCHLMDHKKQHGRIILPQAA